MSRRGPVHSRAGGRHKRVLFRRRAARQSFARQPPYRSLVSAGRTGLRSPWDVRTVERRSAPRRRRTRCAPSQPGDPGRIGPELPVHLCCPCSTGQHRRASRARPVLLCRPGRRSDPTAALDRRVACQRRRIPNRDAMQRRDRGSSLIVDRGSKLPLWVNRSRRADFGRSVDQRHSRTPAPSGGRQAGLQDAGPGPTTWSRPRDYPCTRDEHCRWPASAL